MKQQWTGGEMVLFCILAFIIPLFGWILGGMNINKDNNSPERVGQAQTLLIIGTVSFAAGFFMILAAG